MDFGSNKKMLREVMADSLVAIAQNNDSIIVLDADLVNSSGLKAFGNSFPDRLINCGIQEANMIGVAGGLSMMGYIPFCHSFASFASRRVADQVFLAGVYNQQNIKIIGSDPGIVNSANGGTHMGLEDIGIMRSIPNITIVEPSDAYMLHELLPQIVDLPGVVYIRLARKESTTFYTADSRFTLGKAHEAKKGKDLTLMVSGSTMLQEAWKTAEALELDGIETGIIDMFTVKPLDNGAVLSAAKNSKAILTLENHNIYGGLGSAVAEVLAENRVSIPFGRIGFPDSVGETGTIEYIKKKYSMDVFAIIRKAKALLEE